MLILSAAWSAPALAQTLGSSSGAGDAVAGVAQTSPADLTTAPLPDLPDAVVGSTAPTAKAPEAALPATGVSPAAEAVAPLVSETVVPAAQAAASGLGAASQVSAEATPGETSLLTTTAEKAAPVVPTVEDAVAPLVEQVTAPLAENGLEPLAKSVTPVLDSVVNGAGTPAVEMIVSLAPTGPAPVATSRIPDDDGGSGTSEPAAGSSGATASQATERSLVAPVSGAPSLQGAAAIEERIHPGARRPTERQPTAAAVRLPDPPVHNFQLALGPESGATAPGSRATLIPLPAPGVPDNPGPGLFASSGAGGGSAGFVAVLTAALLLAAPGLSRRLRLALAPWPLPTPLPSLERPG